MSLLRGLPSPLGWLVDWRTFATLAAAGLIGLLGFVVVDNSTGRHEALEALKAQAAQSIDVRQAQSRRIDILQEQVAGLTAQIIALRDQITTLGATPVVTAPAQPDPAKSDERSSRGPGTTTTTAQPAPSSPPPSTTTTTSPPQPTCTTVPVLGGCI